MNKDADLRDMRLHLKGIFETAMVDEGETKGYRREVKESSKSIRELKNPHMKLQWLKIKAILTDIDKGDDIPGNFLYLWPKVPANPEELMGKKSQFLRFFRKADPNHRASKGNPNSIASLLINYGKMGVKHGTKKTLKDDFWQSLLPLDNFLWDAFGDGINASKFADIESETQVELKRLREYKDREKSHVDVGQMIILRIIYVTDRFSKSGRRLHVDYGASVDGKIESANKGYNSVDMELVTQVYVELNAVRERGIMLLGGDDIDGFFKDF
ncbi:MAG: hypothetical protein HRT61_24925, partial [Ekhidna sp.]|nr:hypothetical protein [Ekhidna sp.]